MRSFSGHALECCSCASRHTCMYTLYHSPCCNCVHMLLVHSSLTCAQATTCFLTCDGLALTMATAAGRVSKQGAAMHCAAATVGCSLAVAHATSRAPSHCQMRHHAQRCHRGSDHSSQRTAGWLAAASNDPVHVACAALAACAASYAVMRAGRRSRMTGGAAAATAAPPDACICCVSSACTACRTLLLVGVLTAPAVS